MEKEIKDKMDSYRSMDEEMLKLEITNSKQRAIELNLHIAAVNAILVEKIRERKNENNL